jgi:16S rRNA (uracil1498-N3)-methyltransferase
VSSSRPQRRFRVATVEPGADGTLDPSAEVQRHLSVLRAAVGDVVFLFDGDGAEVRAEVVTRSDGEYALRVLGRERRDIESPLDTCLVQAIPARMTRMETIVRQVTELGVQRVVPVLALRSQPGKANPAALERKVGRWRRVADAAAEQSGRNRVPLIDSPCAFSDIAWETLPQPLYITDPVATEPASDALAAIGTEAGTGDAATVMVGPEGGWTDDEIETARTHGAAALRLGPRVLRADTAGVVAVTLLQYLWGDRTGAR